MSAIFRSCQKGILFLLLSRSDLHAHITFCYILMTAEWVCVYVTTRYLTHTGSSIILVLKRPMAVKCHKSCFCKGALQNQPKIVSIQKQMEDWLQDICGKHVCVRPFSHCCWENA
ncbi:hypothetical protein BX070DRAFT_221238 [Coemansia spiralis]|nr:hypothetical protein BX070DRAFT_221238 [Coemansia spiralis]